MKNLLISFLLACGIAPLSLPSSAQDYSNIRIVRLSFVQGAVQYQRPGKNWEDAALSLPIRKGFALKTLDGYAEVDFEGSMNLRLAPHAVVEFTELALQGGGRLTQLKILQGTVICSAKLKHQDAAAVAAPHLNLNLARTARFRMDVSPAGTWVRMLDGKVDVTSRTGASPRLGIGQTLHVDVTGEGTSEVASNAPHDDFDNWSLIAKKR